MVAVNGEEPVLCPAGEPELRGFRSDGTLARIVRWRPERRTTARLFEAEKRAELAAATDTAWRRSYGSFLDQSLPLPDLVPAYVHMVADQAGHIWLQRFSLRWETEHFADVVAPDGQGLGSVVVPAGRRLLQVGPDVVLLWGRDGLDVEQVALHRLRRGPG